MRSLRPLLLTAALVLAALPAASEAGETTATKSAAKGGIQWFATWKQAQAEAKRTKRPILLIAAAPHCRNVSGMW